MTTNFDRTSVLELAMDLWSFWPSLVAPAVENVIVQYLGPMTEYRDKSCVDIFPKALAMRLY